MTLLMQTISFLLCFKSIPQTEGHTDVISQRRDGAMLHTDVVSLQGTAIAPVYACGNHQLEGYFLIDALVLQSEDDLFRSLGVRDFFSAFRPA